MHLFGLKLKCSIHVQTKLASEFVGLNELDTYELNHEKTFFAYAKSRPISDFFFTA